MAILLVMSASRTGHGCYMLLKGLTDGLLHCPGWLKYFLTNSVWLYMAVYNPLTSSNRNVILLI